MDTRVKKDKHLENQKCHFWVHVTFFSIRIRPFLPRGFFTFLVDVAHGAANRGADAAISRRRVTR